MAKKLTHKYATTLKSFWWKVRIVENQTKRSKQKVIVLSGKEPKIKSKRIRSTKNTENTHVEKNGVSTTMKMSTKGPNEDYARLSCQLKERPQLVCQKRISNRFVHLPWLLFLLSLLLTSLILSLYWETMYLSIFLLFFYSFSPFLYYYVNFCICPHTLTFQRQVHNA